MKIKLITLNSCSRCERLKSRLKESNIDFEFVDCDTNPKLCDYLEDATNTTSYPMTAFISNDEISTLLYIGESYEELNKPRELNGGITGIPVHSIDSMLQYIKIH